MLTVALDYINLYTFLFILIHLQIKKSFYAFDYILYIESRIKCKWIVLDGEIWSIDLVT